MSKQRFPTWYMYPKGNLKGYANLKSSVILKDICFEKRSKVTQVFISLALRGCEPLVYIIDH